MYISQDPIRLKGGDKLYSYTHNPNIWIDVLGLMGWNPGEPKPDNWRLPQNGTWSGEVGHSNFIPSDPASLGLKNGDVIPFKGGVPDFSDFTKDIDGVAGVFEVPNMTGVHKTDMPLIYDKMAELYPDKFSNKTSAKNWLSDNSLTPHHFDGDTVQLVPQQLHGNVRHTGSAADTRIKGCS